MTVPADAPPEAFRAELERDAGPWGRAKVRAFDRLCEAFPDPDGPPEWALRQIVRGQFDRRLPPEWRPVFIEVFHQWLGFAAERDEARARRPGTWRWWIEPFGSPAPRRLGLLATPLTVILLLLVFAGARLAVVLPALGAARDELAARRADLASVAEEAWRAEGQAYLEITTQARPDFEALLTREDQLDRLQDRVALAEDLEQRAAAQAGETLRRTRFPRW